MATGSNGKAAVPAVRVSSLVKRYGETTALAGVDLEVGEGTTEVQLMLIARELGL